MKNRCWMVLSRCGFLSAGLLLITVACSVNPTDADRIVECAQDQVQKEIATASCQLDIGQEYTVVVVPAQGLTAAEHESLTSVQRALIRERLKTDSRAPSLVVFRRDGHYSRALYIGQYFEIERGSVAHKQANEQLRVLLEKGKHLPKVARVE